MLCRAAHSAIPFHGVDTFTNTFDADLLLLYPHAPKPLLRDEAGQSRKLKVRLAALYFLWRWLRMATASKINAASLAAHSRRAAT